MKHVVHSLLLSMLVVVATGCSEETSSDLVPAGTEGGETPAVPTEGGESTNPGITEGDPGESCVDEDGDGFDAISATCKTGNDCDDGNAEINPDGTEICGDSIDQNCDFADESCCEDKDNDGTSKNPGSAADSK